MPRRKLTTQEFIEKSIKVHDNFYTYLKTNYINNHTKVIITCPEHDDFEQTPNNHLAGHGCLECGKNILSKLFRTNKNHFIRRIHNELDNFYIYEKVNYVNYRTKVIITCPIEGHGDFKQTPEKPEKHLKGQGCPKCAYDKLEGSYSYEKAIKGYYNFSGYLYKISLYNEEESFIKIGVSINIKQRLRCIKSESKYNIKKEKIIYYKDFNLAIIKEHKLHEELKSFIYLPKNKFSGRTECFIETS